MNGTARYASTNSLRGVEISRRDDLECLAYMIIYFIMKKLPWQGVKANSLQNRYKKIYYMKKKLIYDENFKQLPKEIQEFYNDIKKLKFEEKPNYVKLKGYFYILLKKNGFEADNNFSWINRDHLINTKEIININERKSNSQKRLMDKLLKNSNKLNKEKKEEEIKHNIKIVKTSSKFKFCNKQYSQNNIINNEYGYTNSNNNKDIKSINEAIDIDVGDFSENEEENNKNNNYIYEKKLRKYNSDIKNKKQLYRNEIKKNDLNYVDKIKKKYEIDINNKKEENKNDKYIDNVEIKNYISFNQNIKKENNKENIDVKDNFRRCNINKNYLINDFKSNKNNQNKIIIGKENINIENINNNNNQKEKELNKKIKRSKSGEKCIIQ